MSDENITPFPAKAEEEKPKQFETTFTIEYRDTKEFTIIVNYVGLCMITGDCFVVQNDYGIPLFIIPVSSLVSVTTEIREIEEDTDGARTVH